MEATLQFLPGGGDGGCGSSTIPTNESTVSEVVTMEKNYLGQSEEESSFSGETELELGLGLGIGSGGGSVKASGWSEPDRMLTAKDLLPSVVLNGGFSSSSRASTRASSSFSVMAVSGTKRAADSVSRQGGSPTGSSQVAVGWPPVRAYRMNSLVNQAKGLRGEEEEAKTQDRSKKKGCEGRTNHGFVKVNMDGVLIGRKLDLNSHSSYRSLAQTVHHMFFRPTSDISDGGDGEKEETNKISRLMDGSSEFVLTYEDRDGDWMLVGDVPWMMFVRTVKKLRIVRSAEAKGSNGV